MSRVNQIKSVVMAIMSLFLEYPFPRKSVVMSPKNMARAVTRDIVPSDWLKLAALCLFRVQRVSKNKLFVTVLG